MTNFTPKIDDALGAVIQMMTVDTLTANTLDELKTLIAHKLLEYGVGLIEVSTFEDDHI